MLRYELATILSLTVIFSHFKYIEKAACKIAAIYVELCY